MAQAECPRLVCRGEGVELSLRLEVTGLEAFEQYAAQKKHLPG